MSDERESERRAELKRRANDAIWTHHTWVSILRRAIADGRSSFTEEQIGNFANCEIGRWLADEIPDELRATALYEQTRRIHERFHCEARNVFRLALAGDAAAASAHMAPVGDFFLAAANMRTALYEWAAAAQPE